MHRPTPRAIEPARPPVPWGGPELHQARRRNNDGSRLTAMVRQHHTNRNVSQAIFLMRKDDPQQAYQEYGKRSHSLGHKGELRYCKVLPCRKNPDGVEELLFAEPEHPQVVIIKMLRRAVLQPSRLVEDSPFNEISAMQTFGNPDPDGNMMECTEALKDKNFLYIIMPHATNGDLDSHFKRVRREIDGYNNRRGMCQQKPVVKEINQQAKIWFKKVVKNMEYVRRNNIAHRDLKGLNVVVRHDDSTTVIDFATSVQVFCNNNGTPHLLEPGAGAGTQSYMAPEMISNITVVKANRREGHRNPILNLTAYDAFATDIWALGIILYRLLLDDDFPFKVLSMTDPFYEHFVSQKGFTDDGHNDWFLNKGEAQQANFPWMTDLLASIRRVKLLDGDARDLLQHMLHPDVGVRLTIAEILSHPWMR